MRPMGVDVDVDDEVLLPRRLKRQRRESSARLIPIAVCSILIVSQVLMTSMSCEAFQGPRSSQSPPRPTDRHFASQSSSFDLDPPLASLDGVRTEQLTEASSSSPLSFPSSRTFAGLSKFHRSILSRTQSRQRFITGRHPLVVRIIHDNPTRSWLKKQGTELLVNDTAPLKSLASFDRFLWLDHDERLELQRDYNMISLELIAEIYCERPAYVQTIKSNHRLPDQYYATDPNDLVAAGHFAKRDRAREHAALALTHGTTATAAEKLWITGFSLTGRKGLLKSVDCETGTVEAVSKRTEKILQWPNEVVAVPERLVNVTATSQRHQAYQDALLVCDGFLVPGKDRGGLRIVKYPGDASREWTVSLTPSTLHRWFYHRAVWMDLTGDGRLSILAARCQVSVASRENGGVTSGISKVGQLVWLECPAPHSIDPKTKTPLESDGTEFDPFSARHAPWKTRVLVQGPDVMFSVADLDPDDDTVEVFSSQFFAKKVSLHSIQKGARPRVVFERTIDNQCGSAFGSILADLAGGMTNNKTATVARVVDAGSTVATVGQGDAFSHLLVTSHECTYAETDTRRSSAQLTGSDEGGSLFAYQIPKGSRAWKTEPWPRSVIASGFKVNGQLSNMINPGAPGLVYTFHARKKDKLLGKRPLIAVAGDCAESAYIFRPDEVNRHSYGTAAATTEASTRYELMVEIKCESTVGSIGIGYEDFTTDIPQEADHAKLYIPCHEKDKILVFALGSGDDDADDGW